jgi:hypothetical protein
LYNHFCRGKAPSITYNKHVSVALVIQHAMYMHHIVISGLPYSCMIFPGYRTNGMMFFVAGLGIFYNKIRLSIFSATFV